MSAKAISKIFLPTDIMYYYVFRGLYERFILAQTNSYYHFKCRVSVMIYNNNLFKKKFRQWWYKGSDLSHRVVFRQSYTMHNIVNNDDNMICFSLCNHRCEKLTRQILTDIISKPAHTRKRDCDGFLCEVIVYCLLSLIFEINEHVCIEKINLKRVSDKLIDDSIKFIISVRNIRPLKLKYICMMRKRNNISYPIEQIKKLNHIMTEIA